MKKLILILLTYICTAQAQIVITPAVAGNGDSDSVRVSFCTFDTTLYPLIADADSIIALRFGPSGALIDSLTQSSPALSHPRHGWYEIQYRASDVIGNHGIYCVYVRVKIGGAWRGAATGSYQVIGGDVGDYLADIANAVVTSGSGAYACTLYVYDSGAGSAVAGAFVRLLNSDQSAVAAMGRSDPNGRLIFSLDDHEYAAFVQQNGFRQTTIPTLVDVDPGGANDSVWLERFDPGEAPTANLCRVYGYVQSLDGRGIDGVIVTARVQKSPLLFGGAVVSPFALTTTTDSSGYWYLDLIPSGELDPDDTKYDVTLHYPSGTILRKQLSIPNAGSFWMRW